MNLLGSTSGDYKLGGKNNLLNMSGLLLHCLCSLCISKLYLFHPEGNNNCYWELLPVIEINAKIKFVIISKIIYFTFTINTVNIKIIEFYLIIYKLKMEEKSDDKILKHKTWT